MLSYKKNKTLLIILLLSFTLLFIAGCTEKQTPPAKLNSNNIQLLTPFWMPDKEACNNKVFINDNGYSPNAEFIVPINIIGITEQTFYPRGVFCISYIDGKKYPKEDYAYLPVDNLQYRLQIFGDVFNNHEVKVCCSGNWETQKDYSACQITYLAKLCN